MLVSVIVVAFGANLPYEAPISHLDSLEAVVAVTTKDLNKELSVIEFYAPWCPHCQHFRPTYQNFATQFHKANPKVKFYAVNCDAHAEICQANNVKGYPTLKGVVGGTMESLYKGDKTLATIKAWASGVLSENGLTPNPISPTNDTTPNPKWQVQNKSMVPAAPVERKDLAATIFATLSQLHGRITTRNLARDETAALHTWIQRLTTLSGLQAPLQPLLSATSSSSSSSSSFLGAPQLTKASFDSATTDLQLWGYSSHERGFLRGNNEQELKWRVCEGEDHGYPCGLWQLLHTLSVHSGKLTQNFRGSSSNDGRQMLQDVRLFIEKFFPCDQCRSHFLKEIGAPDGPVLQSINSREDAIIWLWKQHNSVSKRLASNWGLTEQQVQYPPLAACPSCRGSYNANSPESWRWDEQKVLQYLSDTFSLRLAGTTANPASSAFGRRENKRSRLMGGRRQAL